MKIKLHLLLTLLIPSLLASPSFAQEKKIDELVFIFQKQKNPAKIRKQADKVSNLLEKELKIPVKTQVPGSYAASVQALISKKADVAYLDSIAFLLAKRETGAKVILAESRTDSLGNSRTDYDSIFVVRKDSELQTFEDLKEKRKQLRMIFTSPTSTSGYVMPYKRFVDEGLLQPGNNPRSLFGEVGFGGGYTQALEQVLLGKGDVCAVSYYTMEGDSSNKYLPKEKREQLRILARTPGVPTHVIAVRDGISKNMQNKLKNALLNISKNTPEVLSDVYGTAKFVEVNEDKHILASKKALEYLNLPAEKFVYKK